MNNDEIKKISAKENNEMAKCIERKPMKAKNSSKQRNIMAWQWHGESMKNNEIIMKRHQHESGKK
jgi:hypothetical protein